jgi:hypothetical protein
MSHDKECKCKEMSCTATCERKHTCHTYSCDECAPKQDWEEELNKTFFAGISYEEMGSNQIDERQLQGFIRQLLAEERERIVTEFVEWANTNRHYFDKSLGEPVLGVILTDLLTFADSLKKK